MSKSTDGIGRKFQKQMEGLGLGVSISVGGKEPVAITTYCEKPGHGVSSGSTCLKCEEAT